MAYKITEKETESQTVLLDTIALRGVVVFPGTTASFEIGRDISVNALRNAMASGGTIFLVPQNDISTVMPEEGDLLEVGVVANILSYTKNSDGSYTVVAECLSRADRGRVFTENGVIRCEVREHKLRKMPTYTQERVALRELYEVFTQYLEYVRKPSEDIIEDAKKIREASGAADFLANIFLSLIHI